MIILDVYVVKNQDADALMTEVFGWGDALFNQGLINNIEPSTLFNIESTSDFAQLFNVPDNSLMFYNSTTNQYLGKLTGNEITQANFNATVLAVNDGITDGSGNLVDGGGDLVGIDNPIIQTFGSGGFDLGLPRAAWLAKGIFCTFQAVRADTQVGQAGWGAGAVLGFVNYFRN